MYHCSQIFFYSYSYIPAMQNWLFNHCFTHMIYRYYHYCQRSANKPQCWYGSTSGNEDREKIPERTPQLPSIQLFSKTIFLFLRSNKEGDIVQLLQTCRGASERMPRSIKPNLLSYAIRHEDVVIKSTGQYCKTDAGKDGT